MAFRFRRSIRIAPGLRVNFGKRGMSLSAGVRGASVTFGPRGTYANAGIPGTGLSVRERIGARRRRAAAPAEEITVRVGIEADGAVSFVDGYHQPLSASLVRKAKQQYRDEIRSVMEERCTAINSEVERVLDVHLATPAPDTVFPFRAATYPVDEPRPPLLRPVGWALRLFLPPVARRRCEANEQATREHAANRTAWEHDRDAFDRQEAAKLEELDQMRRTDAHAMETVLEEVFKRIEWPRETTVSYQIDDDGASVVLDVDLPEIEDMPVERAQVPARGWKLSVKALSEHELRRVYATHVHGIAFRLAGEVFGVLPSARSVTVSGYSQRPNPATGATRDDYLLSVRAGREAWSEIAFDSLQALDVIAAVERFTLRRKMTRRFVFSPIEPF